MNREIIELIKQQSISKAALLLGLDIKGKFAMCYTGHDKNASLSLLEKHGRFKCFGCDAKGDIINLVMNVKGFEFIDACNWLLSAFNLSNSNNITITKAKTNSISTTFQEKEPTKKQYNLPNQEIYNWVLSQLQLSEKGYNYLINERGFPSDYIIKLEIKDILHPRIFFSKLRAHFSKQALLDCGLLRVDNTQVKDIWWDYVMIFPFRDSSGDIYYMQGRRMLSDNNKYINLSNLRPAVYNVSILATLKPNDVLVICEGIPDTITAMLMKHNAIGILGATNFNSALVDSLLEYIILVVPDADRGGDTFMAAVRKAFNNKGKTVQKIQIPIPFNDLNEYFINTNHKLQ